MQGQEPRLRRPRHQRRGSARVTEKAAYRVSVQAFHSAAEKSTASVKWLTEG
jgi:hypothetical protein